MKIKLLSAFLVLFAGIALTSCDTEPIDQNVVGQTPDDNGGNGNGNGGGDSTGGDYWPMAINNQWQFESDGTQSNNPMKIIGTETIDGTEYYRVNYFFQPSGTNDITGSAVVHLRKDADTYYQRVSVNVPDSGGGIEINTSPYELPVLKDIAVGQSWAYATTQITSYTVDPSFPVEMPNVVTDIELEGTIIAKGVTATVNGTTYNNVIKEKVDQVFTTHMSGAPDMVITTSTEIWFAKDVGPIRSETTTDTGESLTELVSYIVN